MNHKHILNSLLIASFALAVEACDKEIDTSLTCGNGTRDEGEQCDDGNKLSGDGCDKLCQIERGYSCSQQSTGMDSCATICGDKIVAGDEECDDGNTDNCDRCTSQCKINTPHCGDGFVCGDEQCDDGNDDNCDGCLDTCKIHENVCGDGIVCGTEECDDLNRDACDGCYQCKIYEPVCGDGIVCPGEACDDGNKNNCDSCSNNCLRNYNHCGDGVACGDEECDDGNNDPCDGCNNECKIFINQCGDGIICGQEECDDPTNTLAGVCVGSTCSLDGTTDDRSYPALLKNRRFKKVWSDEFNGPVAGREECYDPVYTATCNDIYWHVTDCDESYPLTESQQSWLGNSSWDVDLADLDKCTWSVFSLYNWMDYGKPLNSGVNAFHPSMVKVKDGTLQLFSKALSPKDGFGSLTNNSNIKDIYQAYNCGNTTETTGKYGTECPIISGGVWSKAFTREGYNGYSATYGRWEVRAKLPIGAGSWPAHWLLPQTGAWPSAGEIDIMEATYKSSGANTIGVNYHGGQVIIAEDGTKQSTHYSLNSQNHELKMSYDKQNKEYHIYSVEWAPGSMEFFVDNASVIRVQEGNLLKTKDDTTGEELGTTPLDVPDIPFFWILNSTVAAFNEKDYPNPLSFDDSTQVHTIDYVRRWEECSTELTDLCPDGGSFYKGYCSITANIYAKPYYIMGNKLFYTAKSGSCPYGGTLENDRCILYYGTEEKRPLLLNGSAYYTSPCKETTLSPSCDNPCEGNGVFKDNRCVIFTAPYDTGVSIKDKKIYTTRINQEGIKPCPYGKDAGIFCEIGEIPSNLDVEINGKDVSFVPSCQPTTAMPNCANPCPYGGIFDGNGCYYGEPPVGTTPSVSNNSFYYTMSDSSSTTCPLGTWDKNVSRCLIEAAPEGATANNLNGHYYLKASCSNVPAADFHHLN